MGSGVSSHTVAGRAAVPEHAALSLFLPSLRQPGRLCCSAARNSLPHKARQDAFLSEPRYSNGSSLSPSRKQRVEKEQDCSISTLLREV